MRSTKLVPLLALGLLLVAGCQDQVPPLAPEDVPLSLAALGNAGDPGPNFTAWSQAVSVGPPVSREFGWDACPFISKDDLELYYRRYVRTSAGVWRYHIHVSSRKTVNDPWGEPVSLGDNINHPSFHSICSFVTIDGHWLYFVSNRTDVGSFGGTDIFVSRRKNKRDPTGWETPKNLGPNINTAVAENGHSIFEDEATGEAVFYFTSNKGGTFKIYSSPMLGKETFGPAEPVAELNSEAHDYHAFIRRRDGLEVIFSSTRQGGLGMTDLWVATRASTSDPWSTPVNLGPEVNSPRQELRPSLSWDGTTLYFWTDRELRTPPTGTGWFYLDIFQTTRTRAHPRR